MIGSYHTNNKEEDEDAEVEYPSGMNATIRKVFEGDWGVDKVFYMHKDKFMAAKDSIGDYLKGETHKMISDAYLKLPAGSTERQEFKQNIVKAMDDVDMLISALASAVSDEIEEEDDSDDSVS